MSSGLSPTKQSQKNNVNDICELNIATIRLDESWIEPAVANSTASFTTINNSRIEPMAANSTASVVTTSKLSVCNPNLKKSALSAAPIYNTAKKIQSKRTTIRMTCIRHLLILQLK